MLEALPFEDRTFVLVLPPLAVDTGAVYGAWDARQAGGGGPGGEGGLDGDGGNDLERAALDVVPALGAWRDAMATATGCRPRLAGSGSAWFVEGSPDALGLPGRDTLVVAGERAPLVVVRTVPGEDVG